MQPEKTTKKRRRFKLPRVRFRFLVFWFLTIGMLAAFIVSQAGMYNELRAELNQVQAAIAREAAEVEQLYLQITFFDSDAYIEQLARERLGMVRPNEIVFRNIASEFIN